VVQRHAAATTPPTGKDLLIKRKLQLEALEDRCLPSAACHAVMPPQHGGQPHAITAPAAPPGGGLAIVELPGQPSAGSALAHGGVHSNHNQTLLRVRRRKSGSR
jgi:hypothetical protein